MSSRYNRGFVMFHRKMLDLESSFQKLTLEQQLLFFYLLMKANYADHLWSDGYRGVDVRVKRGQIVTSRESIKSWLAGKITDQRVRTALKRMEKLGMITIESTNHYTLLTIVNYEKYQNPSGIGNQQSNQELTLTQPRDDQGLTTTKKDYNKNLEEIEFEDSPAGSVIAFLYEKLKENGKTDISLNKGWIQNNIRLAKQFIEETRVSESKLLEATQWFTQDEFWKHKLQNFQQISKHWGQFESAQNINKNTKLPWPQNLVESPKIQNIFDESDVRCGFDYTLDLKGYLGHQPGLVPKSGEREPLLRAADYKVLLD